MTRLVDRIAIIFGADKLHQAPLALTGEGVGDVIGLRQSISVIQQLMQQRMYPLTLKGLEDAMRMLTK